MKIPDFAEQRGLSAATLALFNFRLNGNGWEWDTKTSDGKVVSRWKSASSTRPEDDDGTWAKYRWIPAKPETAKYFYSPKRSLKEAIEDAWGTLYLVGGEPALMTMFEVGAVHATCTFGDNIIPETIADDFSAWGVKRLIVIPDRDQSGLNWACKVRDAFRNQLEVEVEFRALPYPLEKAHGKDVNDFWLESDRNKDTFRQTLMNLPEWVLPEPEPVLSPLRITNGGFGEFPPGFLDAIESGLGIEKYKTDGWSKKHAACPFHDDQHPSADWNRDKAILHCHSGCGKTYMAMEVAEKLGIDIKDYTTSSTPSIPLAKVELLPKVVTEKKEEKRALRPALPKEIELDERQRVIASTGRDWLDRYLEWTNKACPLAPTIFHEAMALWLLATVSTRRMKVCIAGEDIYPNLYILIVAKTSVYRKTTAMKQARKLLSQAHLDCLLLPEDSTPEALFDELSGVKPSNFEALPSEEKTNWLKGRAVAAQRAIMKDECSSIFANLRKEYMGGLTEILLQGYDGDGGSIRKLLKGRGLVTLKDLCLSFLGATTPVMYAKYVGVEEAENGFIARFAVITPEMPPEYTIVDEPVPVPHSLVAQVYNLFMRILPWHGGQTPTTGEIHADVITPPVAPVQIAPEALLQLNLYRKTLGFDMIVNETVDESKAASYTRLGTMVLKVAMILAAIDASEPPIRIEARHAYAAQEICERWRESLHRMERDAAKASYTGLDDKVLSYLRTTGSVGATIRDITRDCGAKRKDEVVNALTNLAEAGQIEKYEHKPEGRGRPSIRYRVILD